MLPADSKTWNFFRAIVDPEDAEAVVIDRHAHDIAAGRALRLPRPRPVQQAPLRHVALAYRLAAQHLDELPSTVQAVTWVVWREQQEG